MVGSWWLTKEAERGWLGNSKNWLKISENWKASHLDVSLTRSQVTQGGREQVSHLHHRHHYSRHLFFLRNTNIIILLFIFEGRDATGTDDLLKSVRRDRESDVRLVGDERKDILFGERKNNFHQMNKHEGETSNMLQSILRKAKKRFTGLERWWRCSSFTQALRELVSCYVSFVFLTAEVAEMIT